MLGVRHLSVEGQPACKGSMKHERGVQLRLRESTPQGPGISKVELS